MRVLKFMIISVLCIRRTLNFAEKIIMVGSYVGMYKMNEKNTEKYKIATDNMPALVQKIVAKTEQPAGKVNEFFNVSTAIGQKLIYARMDKGFNVSDACTGCGTCEAVCPVSNIKMKNKKPSFKHNVRSLLPTSFTIKHNCLINEFGQIIITELSEIVFPSIIRFIGIGNTFQNFRITSHILFQVAFPFYD